VTRTLILQGYLPLKTQLTQQSCGIQLDKTPITRV